MEVEVKIGVEHWKRFQAYVYSEVPRRYFKGWLFNIISGFLWFLFLIVFTGTVSSDSTFHWPTAISVITLFVIMIANYAICAPRLQLNSLEPDIDGPFCGEHHYKLTDEYLIFTSGGRKSQQPWPMFKRVVKGNDLIMLFFDTANAIIFPIEDLKDPEEFHQFIEERLNKYNNEIHPAL